MVVERCEGDARQNIPLTIQIELLYSGYFLWVIALKRLLKGEHPKKFKGQ